MRVKNAFMSDKQLFIQLEEDTHEFEADSPGRVTGFYRFHIGEHELIVINDGVMAIPFPSLAVNAPAADLHSLLEERGLDAEHASMSVGVVLMRTGGRLVLLDNGMGTSDLARDLFGDPIGRLLPTLELLGVSPETITDVIFSHAHADHLGGTSSYGKLTFPNARHYLPQLEWEHLHRDSTRRDGGSFYAIAMNQLQPLFDNLGLLTLYGDEEELVPGIRAVATPGHSTGHHALFIESGDQQLLLPFDALLHPTLHTVHPEWYSRLDQIPAAAVETRQKLLAHAADEQIPVLAYHFPFPGLGRITRDGRAYSYTAAAK